MKFEILVLATLAACLAGCTTTESFGERSMSFNQALDQSVNTTALANVVRASERLPMTYSRLGSMTFTGSVGSTPSATLAFGGDGDKDLITFGASTSDEGSAPFDALVGEEFYNSILKSIDPATVKFYRDQGWPDRILFSLFVERVEIEPDLGDDVLPDWFIDRAGTVASKCTVNDPLDTQCPIFIEDEQRLVIDNDPDNARRFLAFQLMANTVAKRYEISLKENKPDTKPLPFCRPLGPEVAASDGSFAPAAGSGASRRFSKQVCDELKGYTEAYSLDDVTSFDPSTLPRGYKVFEGIVFRPLAGRPAVEFKVQNGWEPSDHIFGCTVDETGKTPGVGEGTPNCNLRIVLRSPNGMLYYLGEIMRAQRAAARHQSADESVADDFRTLCACGFATNPVPSDGVYEYDEAAFLSTCSDKSHVEVADWRFDYRGICPAPAGQSLFSIESGFNVPGGVSSTIQTYELYDFELNGRRYWISNESDRRGRTMQFITLVNEVFFLNQKASESPSVTLLRGRPGL